MSGAALYLYRPGGVENVIHDECVAAWVGEGLAGHGDFVAMGPALPGDSCAKCGKRVAGVRFA